MIFYQDVFAQEMSPYQQWKKFVDIDTIKCKQGHLLMQKNDGTPACVKPLTYEKLIDRGYTKHDSSLLSKRPEMMNLLMHHILTNENLMHHWHDMLQKNPRLMMQTMDDLVSFMKEDPDLMKNFLVHMTSEPKQREKMIEIMKNHPQMENSLKQNSKWMDSVHDKMMNSEMGQMMHSSCSWCPTYQNHSMQHSMMYSDSGKMMDMLHDMWINSEMSNNMNRQMLDNPSHMALMSEQMLEPMLNSVMNDEILRQHMIDLMMEHGDFMNSIRHENSSDKP